MAVVVATIDYRTFEKYAYLFYGVGIVLLFAVLTFGRVRSILSILLLAWKMRLCHDNKKRNFMEAFKRTVKVPRNHEIKIKIPRNVPENEEIEVILIIKEKTELFRQRIERLKEAANDALFLDDIGAVAMDFESADLEGWE